MSDLAHQISLKTTVSRASPPRWASDAISGRGAEKFGGRFNPIGTPALYLSFRPETCLREIGFGEATQTIMLQQIEVTSTCLINLTDDSVLEDIGFTYEDMQCPNWEAEMLQGKTPASHKLAQYLIGQGYHGAVVPSFAAGASENDVNLVLWKFGTDGGARVRVIEPVDLPFKGTAVPASTPKKRTS